MGVPPLTDEQCQRAVDALDAAGGEIGAAARSLNMPRNTFTHQISRAALRGMMGTKPVLPGFVISKTTDVQDEDGRTVRQFIQQKPEPGEEFQIPDGHAVTAVSALVDAQGRTVQQWLKTKETPFDPIAAIKAAIEEFRADLPPIEPVKAPASVNHLLLNQYTITDAHLAALAWSEETGGDNYDLAIAEKLLTDWFTAAVAMAPDAAVGVFAQLGDLLHYDSMESVTPEHRNILDADSRFQKIIRAAIRVIRRIIAMLLAKHERVHIIMAAGNHDPASSAWLRELLFALFENEPRVTVDNSPSVYYAFEFGKVALFYHRGHKRSVKEVASVFAGRFREMFGRCPKAYAHLGHKHNDAVDESNNLMRVEQHRTLAPQDAYAANGGWMSDRDAKVITYHAIHGEVSRITLSPQMVARAA